FSDLHFDGVDSPEASSGRIAETKRLARAGGRDIQVWTPVGIVCRPTQQEANDYIQYLIDNADWDAIGYLSNRRTQESGSFYETDSQIRRGGQGPIERRVLARGAYCSIGDPDF